MGVRLNEYEAELHFNIRPIGAVFVMWIVRGRLSCGGPLGPLTLISERGSTIKKKKMKTHNGSFRSVALHSHVILQTQNTH